jgi:hypothetical protein
MPKILEWAFLVQDLAHPVFTFYHGLVPNSAAYLIQILTKCSLPKTMQQCLKVLGSLAIVLVESYLFPFTVPNLITLLLVITIYGGGGGGAAV